MSSKTLKKLSRSLRKRCYALFDNQLNADGLIIPEGRNLDFLDDPAFVNAWDSVSKFNDPYWWGGKTPDVRWRIHFCLWAARHGLNLEGDFVECGVNTGLFSSMIYKVLQFENTNKLFWLFDTYEGIPLDGKSDEEKSMAINMNKSLYNFDALKVAHEVFGSYPNSRLVKGRLPMSLSESKIEKIAYLSIDLNVASAEIETVECLWDKIVPSGFIILDDFGWSGHREQYVAWTEFAKGKNRTILHSPTGQGLIIK
jgi:O-methyltransferase